MALTQITSEGIKDDSIVNADIKSNAAIAGSKLANPISLADDHKISFGTGAGNNLEIFHESSSNTNEIIAQDGDIHLQCDNFMVINDSTSGRTIYVDESNSRLELGFDGNHDAYFTGTGSTFATNADFSAGVDVTGNITVSGTVDGVDIAALNTTVGTKAVLTGSTNNTIATVTGSNALTGEANLTFDGNNLDVSGGCYTCFGGNATNEAACIKVGYEGSSKGQVRVYGADSSTTGILEFKVCEGDGSDDHTMTLDGSGRLLIGHTSSINSYGENSQLQVSGTGFADSTLAIRRDSADAGSGGIILSKSRGSQGGVTVVQSGDALGSIVWCGADGGDANPSAAGIQCVVDGTPGVNDMPGRLEFYTTNDGAGGISEKMRLDQSGRLLLGTNTIGSADADDLILATSGNTGITIRSDAAQNGMIYFADGTSGATQYAGFIQYYHGSSNTMYFGAGAATRMEVASNGDVKINDGNLDIATAGHGINFGATSQASGATSELFDDYEEGTWSPDFYYHSSVADVYGHYNKIGRMVYAYFTGTIYSTQSNQQRIDNLPFTTENFTGGAGGVARGYQNFDIQNGPVYYIEENTTKLHFYKDNGAAMQAGDLNGLSVRGVAIYTAA